MGKQLIAVALIGFFFNVMMCSPLVANASSEENEWHTNYVYELEEIPLSEVSDSYIQSVHISHEAADRKNILSYDVSSDGSIIVTLKENTIHVYNSDLSLRYRIDTTYNATIIGFWQEDEVIVKFNRGNTALGLDEYGSIVSAYYFEYSVNNAIVEARLEKEREESIGDYTYCLEKKTMLTRMDSQGDEEVVYKNNHAARNVLLFLLSVVTFLSIMAIIIVVKVILPTKRRLKNMN